MIMVPGDTITGRVEVIKAREDKPITELRTTVHRRDVADGRPAGWVIVVPVGASQLLTEDRRWAGRVVAAWLEAAFARADVAYAHLHNARQGCYSCLAERTGMPGMRKA